MYVSFHTYIFVACQIFPCSHLRAGNRKGIRDIWNSFMVKNCKHWKNGLPCCPTKKIEIPHDLITYSEAVGIYNREIRQNSNFQSDSYVCFYEDDYKFDGIKGIWFNCNKALKLLKHFAGIITPDFSTYDDFPLLLKTWNTYKMRAFGFWYAENGINVINNVRWSFDTLEICFSGIPQNNIVCLGTVASGLRKLKNRAEYEKHLFEMVEKLKPKIILTYGSANYDFFETLKKQGIVIKSYFSHTAMRKPLFAKK